MITKPLLLLISCLFTFHTADGQLSRSKDAVIIGYPVIGEDTGDELFYYPLLLGWRQEWTPQQKRMEGTNHLYLASEIQFNGVLLRDRSDGPREPDQSALEAGVHLGVGYVWRINDQLNGRIGGIIGPHFITSDLKRQASGFIFSDNAEAGLEIGIGRAWRLDLLVRFRHISNAGLKAPNGGTDNLFLVAGFSSLPLRQ